MWTEERRRLLKRVSVTVAAVLVAFLIGEILALPAAERAAESSLQRCLTHERLAIESVRRPALPRLVIGRVRDVEITVEGLELGDLRIDRAQAVIPEVRLPWAVGGAAEPTIISLDVEASQEDLEVWLRERVPLGVPVTLELTPEAATLGVERLPVGVSLRIAVADGVLTVQPAAGDEAWWRRLGLAAEVPLPDDLRVDRVTLAEGRLLSTVQVDVVPGLTDAGACVDPFAAPQKP